MRFDLNIPYFWLFPPIFYLCAIFGRQRSTTEVSKQFTTCLSQMQLTSKEPGKFLFEALFIKSQFISEEKDYDAKKKKKGEITPNIQPNKSNVEISGIT